MMTRTQFTVQVMVALKALYPAMPTESVMNRAARLMNDFLKSEKIEYGDPRYGWEESDARHLTNEFECV